VTHSGLLHLASRKGCRGITTILQERLSDVGAGRWVFKATVYKSASSKGFVGYGDADPSNVSVMVHGLSSALPKHGRSTEPAKGVRHRPLLGRGTGLALQ